MTDVIDLLDRRYRFLEMQSGAAYFRELRRWFRWLNREPRCQAALLDLRVEAEQIVKSFNEADGRTVGELLHVRDQAVATFPTIATDQNQPEPDSFDDPSGHMLWQQSIAHFNRIANTDNIQATTTGTEDPSRTRKLITILAAKLHAIEVGPDTVDGPALRALREQIRVIEERHTLRLWNFLNDKLSSPGVALLRVEDVLHEMNPAPPDPPSRLASVEAELRANLAGIDQLHRALYTNDRAEVDESMVRPHAARLYEEGPGHVGRSSLAPCALGSLQGSM